MSGISSRVEERLVTSIRRFQPILISAKTRDVSEADTVTIVREMFEDVFGYDKFSEITAEHAIRGTYCDLAIHFNDKLQTLVEVKAIGHELKEAHAKQAIDYAANQGTEWVVLTNGTSWRVYKVIFSQPIEAELVVQFNFLELDPKDEAHLGLLFLLSREGWLKSLITEYHSQKQALSRFMLGAVIVSDPVVDVIRRELRRIYPDVRVDREQMKNAILEEVLKREVVEGEKADEARRRAAKAARSAREKAPKEPEQAQPADEVKPAPVQAVSPAPTAVPPSGI